MRKHPAGTQLSCTLLPTPSKIWKYESRRVSQHPNLCPVFVGGPCTSHIDSGNMHANILHIIIFKCIVFSYGCAGWGGARNPQALRYTKTCLFYLLDISQPYHWQQGSCHTFWTTPFGKNSDLLRDTGGGQIANWQARLEFPLTLFSCRQQTCQCTISGASALIFCNTDLL